MSDQSSIAYPLLFESNLVEKIWGGKKLNRTLNKDSRVKIGESWEVSAYPDLPSIISNGKYKGKSLIDLYKNNPTQLMGERLTNIYKEHFPLLAKFIHADMSLSVQVHPNNEEAKEYNSLGKNEAWYIIDVDKGAKVYVGFKEHVTPDQVQQAIKDKKLDTFLKEYNPKVGDVFYIPSGTVHAIGQGVLIAEIQQNSDLTFRLYDWDRVDDEGNPRELHVKKALDVLNFNSSNKNYKPANNSTSEEIANNEYFTINRFKLNEGVKKSTQDFDSFVIYMVLAGDLEIIYNDESLTLQQGQSMLVPYDLKDFMLKGSEAEVLEVFV